MLQVLLLFSDQFILPLLELLILLCPQSHHDLWPRKDQQTFTVRIHLKAKQARIANFIVESTDQNFGRWWANTLGRAWAIPAAPLRHRAWWGQRGSPGCSSWPLRCSSASKAAPPSLQGAGSPLPLMLGSSPSSSLSVNAGMEKLQLPLGWSLRTLGYMVVCVMHGM